MEDFDHQSVALIGSNDDLLTEILIRLPVTSILRFKSVSKHWQSLLTHRCFTHRYVPKSPGLFVHTYKLEPDDTYPEPHCLYVPYDVEDQSPPPFRINLDSYFNRKYVSITQSCNGLLLCHVHTFYNGAGHEYYVFNPTTKQLAFITPVPAGQSVSETILSMALAFHQTHCVNYKVVCIRSLDRDENMFQVQVYSSDTGKWKVCIESFSAPSMFHDPVNWTGESYCAPVPIFHDPVYWNGAVQWAPHYRSTNHLYFKIEDERLQMLPIPEGFGPDESYTVVYFGESIGHLHLILHTNREQDSFNMYEMLTDHSRWFVKYRLQLDELLGDFACWIYSYPSNFQVVDVVRGKDEEDTFLVLVTSENLIRYNVRNKSLKELYSCSTLLSIPDYHRYIETLSSF